MGDFGNAAELWDGAQPGTGTEDMKSVSYLRVVESTPPPRQPKGYVYFIQLGDSGPIKIGHAKNPIKRLKALQIGSHKQLRLLAVTPGDAATEKELHREFQVLRIGGEWFQAERPLLAKIRDLIGRRKLPRRSAQTVMEEDASWGRPKKSRLKLR